ncbi:MAG TPA: AAA family ATPase [Methylomirabilota bacterium]|nr:AAA family ATPase [Methylomirabilota bacterium]
MVETPLIMFAGYVVDRENEQLRLDNQPLRLTNKAFAVLRHLVEHPGQLVTKEALFAAIWPRTVVTETTLTNCISEVRRALGDDAKQPRFIETVHRRGYRFLPTITAQPVFSSESRVSSSSPPLVPNTQDPAPILVGREAELIQLHELFKKTLHGERQIVFVTGEAGIGKTALIETFVQSLASSVQSQKESQKLILSEDEGARGKNKRPLPKAFSSGLRTFAPQHPAPGVWLGWGQCIEQYGAGEAYLPVLEALGRLGRQPGGERLLAVLRQYAPTWLAQLPALLSPEELEAVQRRIQGATRERMLREITEAVEVLSGAQPLVLVLEDLHWSDPSTVELLTMLARRREPAQLLVVGTYRAAELAVSNHPLKTVKHELVARGQAAEIALSFLSPAAVREYISHRLGESTVADSLANVVYRRTDGQPLFMVQVTDYLVQRDGSLASATADLTAVEQALPPGLREAIEAQLGRLSEDEQSVLAVGSVGGAEFAVASLAAGLAREEATIEEVCDRLARRGQFIEERGVKTWPDGTVSGSYGFRHALYQEVVYTPLTEARRVRWHTAIGKRLEAGYGEQTNEIAAELAVHFEHGRDFTRAIQYQYAAAQRALGRHASREALEHLTHGLELLPHVPANPIHIQLELMLQTTYGVTLATTLGYAAPAVERAHLRAYELSQELTDPTLLSPILCGLWGFFIARSDLSRALALADHLVALVDQSPHTTAPALAYGIHGQTSLLSGQLLLARTSFEQSLTHYTADQHGQLLAQYNEDPGVISNTFQAQTLWLLGYADQAQRQLAAGEALARDLAHPYSSAQYLCNAMIVWQWRREVSRVLARYEELQAICQAEAFPVWLAGGTIVHGWALAQHGQSEVGVSFMHQGIHAWQAIGICLVLPYYQTLLAEAYGFSERPHAGLQVLDKVLAHINATQERFYEAEVWRIKGELTLQSKVTESRPLIPDPQGEAEAYFLKAIEVARRQQAKSLELRATVSLARLRQQQGKRDEARQMLAGIYNWFTEGFDTKDLQEAKALLDALS